MTYQSDPFQPQTDNAAPEPWPSQPAAAADVAAPPQPAYTAPAAEGFATAGWSRPDAKNWMGITALVTSLLGFSIVGIVFGHLGRSAVRKGEASNPGVALAGLIIGYIFLILGVIVTIAYFALFAAVISDPTLIEGAATA